MPIRLRRALLWVRDTLLVAWLAWTFSVRFVLIFLVNAVLTLASQLPNPDLVPTGNAYLNLSTQTRLLYIALLLGALTYAVFVPAAGGFAMVVAIGSIRLRENLAPFYNEINVGQWITILLAGAIVYFWQEYHGQREGRRGGTHAPAPATDPAHPGDQLDPVSPSPDDHGLAQYPAAVRAPDSGDGLRRRG